MISLARNSTPKLEENLNHFTSLFSQVMVHIIDNPLELSYLLSYESIV